ncbi:MAG: four helix bundle protein [Planctomycetota bacterium]|jgi:four helix bundle protein|nr:four helix bundle protein [Planctomycetota bacterium]
MKYTKFDELPCRQVARELSRYVFALSNETALGKDFSLRDQMWRAAGSAMDNIAEGFDDGSVAEFRRFLKYSQRSCSEVQSQLHRTLDCGYIDKEQFQQAYDLASDCRRQVKAFRNFLGKQDRSYGVAEDRPTWGDSDDED